jgi:hypothetical protein
MSDPVTNAEIEDVLSSIRRLVSTDNREKTGAAKTVHNEQDKLVLTPSQRVDDAPSEQGGTDPGEIGDGLGKPETVASLAQYAIDPEAESDAPEVSPESQQASEDVAQGDDKISEDYTAEDGAGTPEFRHQEIDGSEVQEEVAEGDVSHEPEREPVEAVSGSAEEEAETPEIENNEPPDLQARIASVEAALAGRDDEWEPDGEGEDAYAGGKITTLEWEDHRLDDASEAVDVRLEAAYKDGFEPETEELSEEFTPSSTEQDDHLEEANPEAPTEAEEDWQLQTDVLDEDALRDMVSEIVRQELQGALGERITRNVRKLVRREIHRALASQEFE